MKKPSPDLPMATEIVWFRRDARLHDNPAWAHASLAGSVVPLFVIDPRLYEVTTARRRAYLIGGLRSLDRSLSDLGGRLRVEYGDPRAVVPRIAASVGASSVHVNVEVSPGGKERDRQVAELVEMVVHGGTFVHPPGSVLTRSGTPFRVFTPFYRSWADRPLPTAAKAPDAEVSLDPGGGLPGIEVDSAGEGPARERLLRFLGRLDGYEGSRDQPDSEGTSRLSIDFKYGWLSPSEAARRAGTSTSSSEAFVRQLAWRDFFGQVLEADPESVSRSTRPQYRHIRWSEDQEGFAAWKTGTTGYPIVDAGMRQLQAEGWIHNRVRMIVASFLVKDLMIDWRMGERWFRRQLLDADVAQNVGNWQWVAGTGTDSAPYFRVLNPVLQSRRFDPEGRYIRRWVPEVAALPDRRIHAPWESREDELAAYGVDLGATYPLPIVDHGEARLRAISAYKEARSTADARGTARST